MSGKAVRKFRTIVSLNAFNLSREGLYQMIQKLGGGIGVVFLKGFYKTPPGILINGCILKKMLPNNLTVFKQAEGTNFTSTCSRWPG